MKHTPAQYASRLSQVAKQIQSDSDIRVKICGIVTTSKNHKMYWSGQDSFISQINSEIKKQCDIDNFEYVSLSVSESDFLSDGKCLNADWFRNNFVNVVSNIMADGDDSSELVYTGDYHVYSVDGKTIDYIPQEGSTAFWTEGRTYQDPEGKGRTIQRFLWDRLVAYGIQKCIYMLFVRLHKKVVVTT